MTNNKQEIKGKRSRKAIILGVATACSFLLFAFAGNYFELSKNLDIFTTLYKELNTYYVDEIDPNELMDVGINAMLESLDPYTSFIAEEDMADYRLQTTGKYGGIGAMIRSADDYVIITEPYQGYPADKAGLIPGDRLLMVDGVSTKGKTVSEVSELLKGSPASTLEVEVDRLQADANRSKQVFKITREEIRIDNVEYSGIVSDNIGYIRLAHFTDKAGKEVAEALSQLEKEQELKGVILDLRANPGGLLSEAVNIANVFVNRGADIVSTKGKIEQWDRTFRTLNPPINADIPLAVLVNGGSASASEIVAGAIQDLDRGVVIGQRTFGKGLVQTTRPLSYNTKLKITTAKYHIPSGRCIQAINYADKDIDGGVEKLPDSLKTAFTTKNGRTVYDGTAIEPDVKTKPEQLSKISSSLLHKDLLFQYANLYYSKNTNISLAKDFKLSDRAFDEFVAFLADKDYEYTTKSEAALEALIETAKDEAYYDGLKDILLSLETEMMHDKKQDLITEKQEITSLLEQEILSRYYYRTGAIEGGFDEDVDLQRAIEVLNNGAKYQALLTP